MATLKLKLPTQRPNILLMLLQERKNSAEL